MVDVQTISIVVAAAGVFIAAINSIRSSRRAEEQRQLTLETQQQALETRQAQLFMQVYNRWNSREFSETYGRVRYEYKWNTPEEWEQLVWQLGAVGENPAKISEAYTDYMTLSTYFEGIGVLVKRGLINVDIVEDLLANRVIWWWEMYLPIIKGIRSVIPQAYDHAEHLYNILKQRAQQITAVT